MTTTSALTDLLRAMRHADALEVESRVPIIVISATEDARVAAEALRHRALASIPEPFDARHVETLVTTFFDSIKRREAEANTSSR